MDTFYLANFTWLIDGMQLCDRMHKEILKNPLPHFISLTTFNSMPVAGEK